MSKVVIIDYKLSNLFSVKNALSHIGLNPIITSDPGQVKNAAAAILPGVGAFGDAMSNLKKLKLIDAIKDFISAGKPFMGVCLGMQLLFSKSEEFGPHRGLDIIKGNVVKFKRGGGGKIKIPQIGWNEIVLQGNKRRNFSERSSLIKVFSNPSFMYFVHSYYVKPEDKNDVLMVTNYGGIDYCSAILKDNVLATQFHPEKSGPQGIEIYRAWFNSI